VIGHVSRPSSGEGRQAPDRQMFFVNARPCALPQVAKIFNEVYKSYNALQSPFVFSNFNLDTGKWYAENRCFLADNDRCVRCKCLARQTNNPAA